MRRAALVLATAALLLGPTVLALFSGGFHDGPRSMATLVTWVIVLGLALTGPLPFPRGKPGRVAVLGLAGLVAWSAISVAWAPLAGPVVDNVQRLLLYLGALLASIALLRHGAAARAVEPAFALGAAFVIAYGLSERLVPGVVEFEGSFTGTGRLELPITYYNAQGLLAAVGFVLAIRLAGDVSRPTWLRAAAAAACTPLGVGVYLSYSRGALAAAVLGVIIVLAAAPTWPQLRGAIVGLISGVVASACSAALPGVASVLGTAAEQQRDGAIMLAILVVLMVASALVTRRLAAAERRGSVATGTLAYAHRLPAVAATAAALWAVGLVTGGVLETAGGSELEGATPSRLASVSSLRYEYWAAGLRAFERQPLIGHGSGSFRVVWRTERRINAGVVDVHSLVLEQLVELGVLGLAFLALFVGGVAAAGRRALRDAVPLAPGVCAACVAWLLHASIDWDWQLPAVTLPAVVLAGALVAASERSAARPSERRATVSA